MAGTTNINLTGNQGPDAALNAALAALNTGQQSKTVSTQASGTLALAAADSGKVYSNIGATGQVTYNLPTAAAGLTYTFTNQDSDGIAVVAAAGDTIRIGTTQSPAPGSMAATALGATITLIAVDANEWVGYCREGTWVLAA